MPLSSLFSSVRQLGRGRPQAAWRVAWRLSWALLLLAWSLLLLAWLTLHWFILPRLDDWRPELAAQASRALGHPVQIGRIAVQSAGWIPAFTLHEVVILDAQGRVALRLPKVSAALSVPSALAMRLRFEQLLIEDARLEVRRDVKGRWSVGGLDMDETGPALDGSAAADWFFEQHEFLIRGGTLRWVDEMRGAPPLQLSDVQLLLRNRGQRHELRLDATPPADWGVRFAIVARARGALLSRAGDWTRWKGTVFADLPRADVSQLRRHVDLPVDLRQGEAALRAWVDWDQGQPTALTLDAALRDVSMRLAPELAPVALAELGGRFVVERQSGGGSLAAQGLHFRTADGQSWAPSQLRMNWRQAAQPATATATATASQAALAARPVIGGEVSADRLDLALMAELGERLPIGAGLRRLLQQLDPEGRVQTLKARWEGPLDAPLRYSAQASVKGLAISAAPAPGPGGIGRPGWRGADLELKASEAGGQAELALKNGALDLPGVFEQALVPLTNFKAQLRWRIDSAPAAAAPGTLPRVELTLQDVRFDNADVRGGFNASWHTGAGSGFGKGGRLPGVLVLDGQLSEARALAVARYLPLGIDEVTRHWVQRAVQGGELRKLSYRVKGDLFDFPFVNRRDGDFRIAGQLLDVTLAPLPSVPAGQREPAWDSPWPAFSAISGELVFERHGMSFQQARGRLWGVELSEVQGRIRDLSADAVLEVEGLARGPAADLLRYLRVTPLAGWTGHALDSASASGPMELRLALNIPLAHPENAVLKADLQLPGNDVRLRPDLPLLVGARGRIEASTQSVQLAGVRAQLLGGETQIEGGSLADGSLRFVLNGSASAEGLRRIVEPGITARLAQRLQGQAAYRLQLGWQAGALDWQLASNLQGLAINLPAPLAKPAQTTMALRLSSTAEGGTGSGRAARDWLRLEMGPIKAQALVEATAGGARPQRSALAWDAPLPEPVAGGRAVLALPRLDVDAWRSLLASVVEPTALPGGDADSPWLPRSIQLLSPELMLDGRRFSAVSLELQRLGAPGEPGWRAQLQADQASGSVDWREPGAGGGAGRIQARLARLALPPAESRAALDATVGLLDSAPASVPALDIEVEDFELRGRKLGRLVVEAANRAAGGEPGARAEWRLNKLQLGNADARLQASGRWRPSGEAARRMQLDFKLDIDDGGALLQRLGYGQVLRGTQGSIGGTLGWAGSPLEPDLPSLNGQLTLSLNKGQFLQVDPGAARLLSVLNLQALPRRFLLDFRDVFDQGFAFDRLTGDLLVKAGVAQTENLRLSGLQALVLMAGSADIGRETQDLQVVVVPELNTGSASLAYAAINPAVGLGAFLGQWLLREPLRMASAREFHVSGRWDEPKVERVERKLLEPLPAAAAEAPPASAPQPRARP